MTVCSNVAHGMSLGLRVLRKDPITHPVECLFSRLLMALATVLEGAGAVCSSAASPKLTIISALAPKAGFLRPPISALLEG